MSNIKAQFAKEGMGRASGQDGGFYNYEKKEYIDQDTGALTQVIRTEYKNQKNSVDTADQKKLILLSTNELPVVKHVQHEQTKAKAGFHIQNENFDFDMDNNLQKAARALPRRVPLSIKNHSKF